MSNEIDLITRRDVLKGMGVLGAGALALGIMGQGQAKAAPGVGQKSFKVGLIGCGGRGKGACGNILEAAQTIGVNVEIYAVADYFLDKAKTLGEAQKVPAERCFGGIDAYKKLLAQPVDLVMLATAPLFRPLHLEAALKANKHVFFEKPVAVDPPGCRKVIALGKEAQSKGLCIVAGTQRRHSSNYLRNKWAIDNGAIGKIKGGMVYWAGGSLWVRDRAPGMTDADYMINNWGNFAGMSGDHIVEQHIHNIDVANWFIGRHPVMAIGVGGRARRKTGDQFDFFAIDYDYGEDCHIHSMCRQVPGCYSRVDEEFIGTEGSTKGAAAKIDTPKAASLQIPEFPTHANGQVQEHIDLLNAIMAGKPNSENEALNVANSVATVIMGRISAYTGQYVRWSDMMENESHEYYNLTMKPTAEDFEAGPVKMPAEVPPVPGQEGAPKVRAAKTGAKGGAKAAGAKGEAKGKGKGQGKRKKTA